MRLQVKVAAESMVVRHVVIVCGVVTSPLVKKFQRACKESEITWVGVVV